MAEPGFCAGAAFLDNETTILGDSDTRVHRAGAL